MSLKKDLIVRVPVRGGEIVAQSTAASAGAVLFLHGWTLDRRLWAPQLSDLGADYFCIAIDRRGFGRSTAPASLAEEGADILAVLDHFGIEKAVIVGMSQAGRIAAEFAIQNPARTAGLILHGARIGVSPGDAGESDAPVETYASMIRAGRLDDMKTAWRGHALMKTTCEEAARSAAEMLRDYDGRDLASPAQPSPEIDIDRLLALNTPILLVTGELDTPLRRKLADELHSELGASGRIEISGAGHMCNLDAPAAYNRALRGFLENVFAAES